MRTGVFERWADSLVREGVISEEDADLYSYGLWQGALFVLNIVAVLLIGALLGEMAACLVFMACYLPLRRMAGGYHARTPGHCFLLGLVLIAAALAAVKGLPWTVAGTLCAAALASVLIWCLAPVADENKPLDAVETLRYRGQARKLTLCVNFAVLVGLGVNPLLARAAATALVVNSVMLSIGWALPKAKGV